MKALYLTRWPVLTAVAGSFAWAPSTAQDLEKHVIAVPGFATFAEIDPKDHSVWINHENRVEHWSTKGKFGQIGMPKPCSTMVIVRRDL